MPHRRNGSETPGHSMPPSDLGVLRERVYNVERNIQAFHGELSDIRAVMATTDDVKALASSVNSAMAKLEQVGRPQWQAIGVMLTFALAIGALVYWPIREKQADQATRMERLEEGIVRRSEHQERWRQIELADARRKEDFDSLRSTALTRGEATEFRAGQTARATELQRQIDEIRKDVGGVVTTRDVLQSLDKKIERLEVDLRASRGNGVR